MVVAPALELLRPHGVLVLHPPPRGSWDDAAIYVPMAAGLVPRRALRRGMPSWSRPVRPTADRSPAGRAVPLRNAPDVEARPEAEPKRPGLAIIGASLYG